MLCRDSSLSFDGSLRELFWPWSVGARVVLARADGHRDPDYLIGLISGEEQLVMALLLRRTWYRSSCCAAGSVNTSSARPTSRAWAAL